MRFASASAANRMPSVLPLLGVSLLPALLVLGMICSTLSREEETVRLPTNRQISPLRKAASGWPRPPTVRQTPTISVRLSRQGVVTVAGETIADDSLAGVWQRERAAVGLLGFEPSQATVVLRADRELSTDRVERVLEAAQAAGFSHCVLRTLEQK
jgi:biopolymer transport protein ExbD